MKMVLGLFVGFWALIFIAGAANPGYVHYREHVSLLAADGNALIWVTTLGDPAHRRSPSGSPPGSSGRSTDPSRCFW